jgi:hypothetical protein
MVRQQNLLTAVSQELANNATTTTTTSTVNPAGRTSSNSQLQHTIAELRRLQRSLVEDTGRLLVHMATDLQRLHQQYNNSPSLEKPWVDILLPYFEQSSVAPADKTDLRTACVRSLSRLSTNQFQI